MPKWWKLQAGRARETIGSEDEVCVAPANSIWGGEKQHNISGWLERPGKNEKHPQQVPKMS